MTLVDVNKVESVRKGFSFQLQSMLQKFQLNSSLKFDLDRSTEQINRKF